MTPIVEIVNLKKRYPPVAGAKEGQLAGSASLLAEKRNRIKVNSKELSELPVIGQLWRLAAARHRGR